MAALLPVITVVSTSSTDRLEDAEEFRVMSPLSAERVTGDGPTRVELSVAGGVLTSLTGTPPIVVTAGLTPVVSINAATTSLPGSMSAADKTKLDNIGDFAAVQQVQLQGALTFGVGSTAVVPIINIPAASAIVPGSQSTAHFTLVNGATSANTASTIVKRGASGEFTAGIVTAEGLAVSGESSTFGSDVGFTAKVETYAANIEMVGREGGLHEVTLTGNVAFDVPIAHAANSTLAVRITQGSGGLKLATWASAFRFPVGMSGTLVAVTAGDIDYFEFKHFTTPTSHWMCRLHVKYSPP